MWCRVNTTFDQHRIRKWESGVLERIAACAPYRALYPTVTHQMISSVPIVNLHLIEIVSTIFVNIEFSINIEYFTYLKLSERERAEGPLAQFWTRSVQNSLSFIHMQAGYFFLTSIDYACMHRLCTRLVYSRLQKKVLDLWRRNFAQSFTQRSILTY